MDIPSPAAVAVVPTTFVEERPRLAFLLRRCKNSLWMAAIASICCFAAFTCTSSIIAGLPLLVISLITACRGIPLVGKIPSDPSALMFVCLSSTTAAIMTFFLWLVVLVSLVYLSPPVHHQANGLLLRVIICAMPVAAAAHLYASHALFTLAKTLDALRQNGESFVPTDNW